MYVRQRLSPVLVVQRAHRALRRHRRRITLRRQSGGGASAPSSYSGSLHLPSWLKIRSTGLEVVANFAMMPSMSMLPTVITGVVGVAGIIGTILAARITAGSQTANLMLSLNDERSRARLVDKRQVYANFIAAAHEAHFMMTWVYVEKKRAKEQVPISELYKLRAVMASRLSEIELVGTEEVISSAQALSRYVTQYFASLIEIDLVAFIDPPETRMPVNVPLEEVEKRLNEAMRVDLGVEPVDTTGWSA